MEKSEYFKLPKLAKDALKRVANRSEEEQAEVNARMHKASAVMRGSGSPKTKIQRRIYTLERDIDRADKSKSINLKQRIPRLESELKRLKSELEALQD